MYSSHRTTVGRGGFPGRNLSPFYLPAFITLYTHSYLIIFYPNYNLCMFRQ